MIEEPDVTAGARSALADGIEHGEPWPCGCREDRFRANGNVARIYCDRHAPQLELPDEDIEE